jgi:hydroxymethylpyrimidine pyrophosphatase-like HAD family hydrolase
MVQTPDDDPGGGWDKLRPALGEIVEGTWSAERAPLEVAAYGVSKASALTRLCAEWGIAPEEVVAFGDAPNDLPMLSWAGTAYAVANAHAPVLASTPLHTAGNDEDGVAAVLEALVDVTMARHREQAAQETPGEPAGSAGEPESPLSTR